MFNLNTLTKRALFKCSQKDQSEFKKAKCCITISVGQPIHEGDKLLATIIEASNQFKECMVMVCDSLQRYTLSLSYPQKTMDEVKQFANQLGSEWLNRYQETINSINVKCKIIRWDNWLFDPRFGAKLKQIESLYESDPNFYNEIQATASIFTTRYANKAKINNNVEGMMHISKKYLIEECAVMLLLAEDKYQFEIYPSPRNQILRYVHKHIVSVQDPKLVREISIKYKKTSPNKQIS